MASILIVEDDVDIREALREVLSDEGFDVATAGHGREALDLLAGGLTPAVILLDLMMPVMNGWQFAEAYQAAFPGAGAPIIALSADANVQAKASSLGASGFLKKPVLIEDLLAAIESELAKKEG